ncbi:bacillithiol biosynthesis cysteine-adding enzyme BshC [Hazenella sp. IB182353]|uniref:bacillithiol biosynthesis cysteine-adding enzyme BshC n=1 Tax=Polycladospora coralii TaxID=2771432 RepID=UPI00174651C4|nr:bacillithiol biosynthesis cysteine-adding enzyme BshC [Polycladospora coralii]MBS7530277.1 bacillithiol biosynthesis cysteine-adding enzyme BshC [Polycladospora coralii]
MIKKIVMNRAWKDEWMDSYEKDDAPIHSFYTYSPYQADHFVERAMQVDKMNRSISREQIADVIANYMRVDLWNGAVQDNIAKLQDDRSLVVIAGQQAGLLGGPLYTIYKAITAIQLAKREEERLNRPVVPVFWIAGEDHDLEEVDHVHVISDQNNVQKKRFHLKEDRKRYISAYQIETNKIHNWLDELAFLLPDTIFKQDWLKQVKSWTTEPLSWSRFFARLMHDLFAEEGLLIIDAADPGLRKLEAPFFQSLIQKHDAIDRVVRSTSYQIEQLGYKRPVEFQSDQGHLFFIQENERLPLSVKGDMWETRNGAFRKTQDELVLLAGTNPHLFSNNVITRPLMQEFLFPTLAFVGGPGEVKYWGLLKEAFTEMNLEMPIVYPRMHGQLIGRKIQKRLREFGLTGGESILDLHRQKTAWLQRQVPIDVDKQFSLFQSQIEMLYEPLMHTLQEHIGHDVVALGAKNKQKVMAQASYYRMHVHKLIQEKHQTGLNHWVEIESHLWPNEQLQERMLGIIPIWNGCGLDWLRELKQDLSLLEQDKGTQFVFYL